MVVGMALSAVTGVFKAIGKTKKATWGAMKGAYGAAKGAAGPMGAIASALKVFAPIMKVVNALFKFLGATILKTVLPAMRPLLEMLASPIMLALMEDIGKIIGIALIPAFEVLTTVLKVVAPVLKNVTEFFLKNKSALTALILVISPLLGILLLLKNSWGSITGVLKTAANGFIWFVNAIIKGINLLMNSITFGLWGDIPILPSLQHGTSSVPRTGPYLLHKDEAVITAKDNRKGRGEIHVHIDLRNAVVDNVDRLSQKIAEAVLIQIG
jgi:phage-related protein